MARNEQVFRDLFPHIDAAVPFPDAIFSPQETCSRCVEGLLHLCRQASAPGVSELFVHLAHDDAEMRAVTELPGWDAAWRQRDLDVIQPEFRQASSITT